MEIVPNLRPIVFWLKVRTRGPQPSICVPTFSQFTRLSEPFDEGQERIVTLLGIKEKQVGVYPVRSIVIVE